MKFAKPVLDRLITSCLLCGANRAPLKTTVIKSSNKAELVHIHCQSCKGALIAVVFTSGHEISSVGMLTDLTSSEVEQLEQRDHLTEDDLLAVHRLFNHTKLSEQLLNNY